MKIIVYNTKPYDRRFLEHEAREFGFELDFLETRLSAETAKLAHGYEAAVIFVNDVADKEVLSRLAEAGIRYIALRCAGYNNVDLQTAKELSLSVVRVPAYSPHAVAEHTVGLILSLNRGLHRAYSRVRDGNFSLNGLVGFDLYGRTVGVIGTGSIGLVFAGIMRGFGCRIVAYDPKPNHDIAREQSFEYVDLRELFTRSDIISLHCPLTPETHHLVDGQAISQMKDGVMLINTCRGAVIETRAVIEGLKKGKIGHLGLDVYEEEADFFFEDLSNQVIPDDTLSRLLTFPNVIVTSHQAFLTEEALKCIARTTITNLRDLEQTGSCSNSIF